jgi:hypothetical protein
MTRWISSALLTMGLVFGIALPAYAATQACDCCENCPGPDKCPCC